MRYSPRPIESYFRETHTDGCPIRGIAGQECCSDEMWNLYWLSVPELEGTNYTKDGWITVGLKYKEPYVSVSRDVLEDYHLAQALSWSPSRFLDWFCREDPTIYDCYEAFGSGWVETVKRRAMEAAERLEQVRPEPKSNVVRVNFGAPR